MNKINGKILTNRIYEFSNCTQKTIQFSKPKHTMEAYEVNNLVQAINAADAKKGKNTEVTLIKVLNGANWQTFTDLDSLQDYYGGKVKDVKKFEQFFQVQITIQTQK